jgi:hypothetical protein
MNGTFPFGPLGHELHTQKDKRFLCFYNIVGSTSHAKNAFQFRCERRLTVNCDERHSYGIEEFRIRIRETVQNNFCSGLHLERQKGVKIRGTMKTRAQVP